MPDATKRQAAARWWRHAWSTVRSRPLASAAVVAAALELLVGLWLLANTWHGSAVAAPFTRVGGATRVETAVEASRFWLKPPRFIVEVGPSASKAQMLDAARCAMAKDAPLLFTSRDPKRNRLVTAKISAWHESGEDLPGGSSRRAPRSGKTLIVQWNGNSWKRVRMQGCLPRGQSDIPGVSTLAVPRRLLRLHRIAVSGTLDPVAVFAAVWAPKDPADVAVGMALAAHLARAKGPQVSLVVVPRYLQADPGLENQLRNQRQLVNGVVLGSASVLPEDTHTLLRQLLIPVDEQGVLAQLENTFGTAGILISALIALITFGVAAATAPPLIRELVDTQRSTTTGGQATANQTAINQIEHGGDETVARNDWLTDLRKARQGTVTIWLRSGGKVTGTVNDPNPGTVGPLTALRLHDVRLWPDGSGQEQHAALYLLVPLDDIKLIGVDVKPIASTRPGMPGGPSANQAAQAAVAATQTISDTAAATGKTDAG